MYNNETKDKFVELRVEGLSFDKIAAQLGTSKSTLHRWAEEREADILRLRRLQWEEMENEFGWRFEHQLLELDSSIDVYEEHLRRIPVSQLSVRETVMLLRESRRQRDRLRALLMGTGTPSRKSNKTERIAENATTQPRNTNDLQQSDSKSFDFETAPIPDTPNPHPAPASQSQIANPKSQFEEPFLGSVVVNPYECAAAVVLKTLEQQAAGVAQNGP